ncbi:hypothetical protein [Microvirga splendida]|uniref:Uncharacterized protein n=1 Tax=Microvirga splendida TaxID=2795727 RepID=A0ABS0Y005_9HYPH|nr:hypothetical protein [Microvirga splendida]MBJ6125639.1 hypothetical protein [Microvirga splendida]
MPTNPRRDENPQGLATFDPMTHPGYRAVARRITDKYLRENGMEPWTWPEDVKAPGTRNPPGPGGVPQPPEAREG